MFVESIVRWILLSLVWLCRFWTRLTYRIKRVFHPPKVTAEKKSVFDLAKPISHHSVFIFRDFHDEEELTAGAAKCTWLAVLSGTKCVTLHDVEGVLKDNFVAFVYKLCSPGVANKLYRECCGVCGQEHCEETLEFVIRCLDTDETRKLRYTLETDANRKIFVRSVETCSDSSESVSENAVRIHVSCAESGRQGMAQLAREIVENKEKLSTDDITEDFVSANLCANRDLESAERDPELGILFGDSLLLPSLLPWHTSFTEFVPTQTTLRSFGWADYLDILGAYTKRNKRFGK